MRVMKLAAVQMIDYELCDLCGCVAYTDNFSLDPGYPSVNDGSRFEFDLCSDCLERAVEMLEANGVKIRKIDTYT